MKKILTFLLVLVAFIGFADQTKIPDYDDARDKYIYPKLYKNGGKTFYCKVSFSSRKGLQVEHIFPASWMKDAAGCSGKSRKWCRKHSDRFNLMEADLHNLHPAIGQVNQDRSNYLFDIIGNDDSVKVYKHPRILGGCDFEVDPDMGTIEPPKNVRGDVARAVFYIMDEYGSKIDRDMLSLLLDWNTADKPDEHEKWRNNEIEKLQGNRNKFIDDYLIANTIFSNPSPLASNEPPSCDIKGNISRSGRIYHSRSSRSYNKVKIDLSKGERWFCSIEEAESAGWRAPRN